MKMNRISTLLHKHCNKKQETEECILKLYGYIYHQGTYTPQAGNEKGTGFLPFTGVRLTLLLSVIVTCYFFMCLDGLDAHAGEYVTRLGKSLFIEESHPFGQSLSYIQLRSSGFEHDLSENLKNSDPIQEVSSHGKPDTDHW